MILIYDVHIYLYRSRTCDFFFKSRLDTPARVFSAVAGHSYENDIYILIYYTHRHIQGDSPSLLTAVFSPHNAYFIQILNFGFFELTR